MKMHVWSGARNLARVNCYLGRQSARFYPENTSSARSQSLSGKSMEVMKVLITFVDETPCTRPFWKMLPSIPLVERKVLSQEQAGGSNVSSSGSVGINNLPAISS